MINKVYGILGLSKKAGKLIFGSYICEKEIKSNKIKLLIIANDASEKTIKKFKSMCELKNVTYRIFGKQQDLGKYLAKEKVAIIGIKDDGFSDVIISIIDKYFNNGGEK